MKIAVIGTGYVGLVAGACLAENGNDVVCVDKDAAKVRALQRGRIPIYEPGLEELVRRNRAEKRLTFTTDLPQGVRELADHLHRRRHADGRRRLGRPAARARGRATDRQGDERLQGHRRQEHGAGRAPASRCARSSRRRPTIPSASSATPSS